MSTQYQFDLISYRHVTSKKSGKKFTIVSGVIYLEKERSFVEFFMPGESHYQHGLYVLDLDFSVSFDRKLEARINSILPAKVKAAA